jgi:hypothetical protein
MLAVAQSCAQAGVLLLVGVATSGNRGRKSWSNRAAHTHDLRAHVGWPPQAGIAVDVSSLLVE